MKKLFLFTVALLTMMLAGAPAFAQLGSGTLSGVVSDDQGNPLPGVTVTAKNADTGWSRIDVTAENGQYRIPSVPHGNYDVSAELSSFATQVKTGIRVDVGRTISVNFGMRLSTTAEVMEITGETPLIEKTESHISTVVTPEQVENLPLNGRQFANLGALAPGTTLTFHPDPTRPNNLAVSMIGGSGRNMNVTVDGGDNNDDTVGGINQFFSLESVAEFTLLTNRYKAEYGRSSGGVLNVVTKSGTNDFHGSFFSLFRTEEFNAKTEAEKNAGADDPNPYSREQFGGSVGGPIAEDRAFFFFAAERSQADQQSIVDTQGIAPEFDGNVAVPTDDTLYTAKVTANIDPRQFMQVRYGQQKTETIYGAAPNYAPNARGTLTNDFHSFLASHNWVVSEDKLNEFTFQYADFKNAIRPTSEDPTQVFPNGVYLGQNINTPQTTEQKKYQFRDDFSWSWRGNHHMKAGLNWVHEPTLGGTFTTGTVPQFYHLGNDRNSPVNLIQFFGGEFADSTPNDQVGFYFQDDWNVNEHMTLNLGLRYDVVTGLEIDQSQNSLYQVLHNKPEDFSWLDPFQESADGSIEMDKNNFQPRIGVAYDLNGDGETVLRGGWGLYYDFPYTNANLLFPLAALGGYGTIYSHADANGIRNPDGSFFQVGDPLPPNQLPGLAAAAPRDVLSPDWVVPYTSQFSAGFSHQLSADQAIDVDYVHVAVRDQYIRFRFNGTLNGARYAPDHPASARIYAPLGESDYDGVSFGYRARVTERIQVHANYTLSKVEGNTLFGADEFRLGSPGTCAHCPLDWRIGPLDDPRMFGPLNTDARHRLVLSGIFELPADFTVSGFFRANSAKPFNAVVGSDLNGDGNVYDTTDEHVNSRRGEPFSQLDIRVAKGFEFGDRLRIEGIFEVFNLFNAKNPGANNNSGNAYNGLIGDPNFGEAIFFAGDPGQGEQRLAQIGFRVEF